MLDFVFNNFTEDPKPGSVFFNKIIKKALKKLKLDKKGVQLSLILVGVDKMRKLNHRYRGKNKATDVLSFGPKDGEINYRKTGKKSFVLPKVNVLKLGDIVICPEIARKEAKKDGLKFEEKMAELTVHGLLHLLGYDHEKSKKAGEEMFKLQNEILNYTK